MWTGLGGGVGGVERVGVFSATRLRVPWGQGPHPGIFVPQCSAQSRASRTGYQLRLPVCPQLTSKATSQAVGQEWDVSPGAAAYDVVGPPDAVAAPLRDDRRASTTWPRCHRHVGCTPQSTGLPRTPKDPGPHGSAASHCAPEPQGPAMEMMWFLYCSNPVSACSGGPSVPVRSYSICPWDLGDPFARESH